MRSHRANVNAHSMGGFARAAYNRYRIIGERRIFEVFSLPQIRKTLECPRARFNVAGQNLEQLTRQA